MIILFLLDRFPGRTCQDIHGNFSVLRIHTTSKELQSIPAVVGIINNEKTLFDAGFLGR